MTASPLSASCRSIALACVLLVMVGIGASPASAADTDVLVTPQNCREGTPNPDGTRRQSTGGESTVVGLSGIPPRQIVTADAGQSTQVCIGFQNRSPEPADYRLSVENVGVDSTGAPLSSPEAAAYGAGDWIRLPARQVRDVQPQEIAWLLVPVRVPADAAAGGWYASVTATQVFDAAKPASTTGNRVSQTPAVSIQLFFELPGTGSRGGNINEVRAPRVIWWDGWNISSVRFLDRFRGPGIAPVRFQWRNGGDYSDTRGGTLVISSGLTGKVVERITIPEQVVLRGSSRDFEATWKRNIPMIGRFTAVIEMRGSDGSITKRELPAIWVVPAWWYVVLLFLALLIPISLRVRSRRRYAALLARVEAAERSGASEVESWDEDWDSSSGPKG